MTGPWVYDPNATGSARESGMSGGGGVASWSANLGGMSGTTGLLEVDEAGKRGINGRVAATTLLSAGAAAAGGAVTFCAAAGPGGAVAGAVLGTVGAAVSGGLAAYDAQKTIAGLKQVETKVDTFLKTNPGDADAIALKECITYCVGKSGVKFNKGVANATIAGQPLTALYKTGKAIYKFAKGTKGVNRRANATSVVKLSEKSTVIGGYAREVVKAIIAKDYEKIATDAIADAMKSG